jgi:hypothetical protein
MASASGHAPLCNRLTRLPAADQIGMAAELAIAIAQNEVSRRNTWNSITGEVVWFWPRGGRNGDWWMLPIRTMRLAERITWWTGGYVPAMHRIARRQLAQREWHRQNGGPHSLPEYGKMWITLKQHHNLLKLVTFGRPPRARMPRVVGYQPVYVGKGTWKVMALDKHENTIRMIGPYETEEDAIACARRCAKALWRLTYGREERT